MKDYYAILNVSSTASADEIKRSFRQLALRYHPDKNPDPNAEVRFKEINEAYDVLGDGVKRQQYDSRRQNPFAEILEQAPEPPRHRDPAYRRRRPARPPGPRVSESMQLMIDYIKYFRWIAWIGIIFSTLLFTDLVLPYKVRDESVVEKYTVRGRRGGVRYFVLVMSSGEAVKIYPEHAVRLSNYENFNVAYSFFFTTPMWIADRDGANQNFLGYIYGGLIVFPFLLWVVSTLGIVFRKRIEFCFNASIVSGVLICITWYLM